MKGRLTALSLGLGVSLAMAVSYAQAPPKHRVVIPATAAVTVAATHIPQAMLWNLEKAFDVRLEAMDSKDPLDLLGGTRGLYVQGFGTVFTTEVSLIVTPGISPFRPTISDELKLQVHQRKLAHLPQLEDLMKDLMKVSALTLNPLPDDQKVMYAVRLRYLPYENTAGLPAQILMTSDKKSAILGDIKTKVE
jgi:hypothetical protein